MMTDLEVKAKCLGRALRNSPNSFGANEAKVAIEVATKLFQAGKCDTETFTRTMTYLGNHSAIRQWAVQHGFIATNEDALTKAVQAEITALDKELDEIASA